MNSTNTTFGTKRSQKKTDQFIIKPLAPKKTQSGSNPNYLRESIKPKVELKPQLPPENSTYNQQKAGNPFEKIQRNISKEEINEKRNYPKATPNVEVNMEDYVKKHKYEELQKKYEFLLKKHDESKQRIKHIEHDYLKEKKRNDEISVENNKLKAKIRELEEKNKDLLKSQQTGTSQNNNQHRHHHLEENKNNDEINSLHLAMRLEAENALMDRLSQIAALQMLFERPEHNLHTGTEFGHQDNINPDNMTYEELLQLEERIGKVSKGLTIEQIKKIPKRTYTKYSHKAEEMCSICYCEFETGMKTRKLPCSHDYHSKCIKTWLLNEKTCPICKKEVETS